MNKILQKRQEALEEIAKSQLDLDFFPVKFEVVPPEVMLEVMSYGLPTRARHWIYGQSYEYQKITGEMGHSKVYEIVLNNDPSYAFLMDTNTITENTMVIAHVLGHSHFFKNNYMFKKTDRRMVYHAAERSNRIDGYIEKYGLEKVEHLMNIGFALDKHIDWHKGENRKPYPDKKKVYKRKREGEFEDLLGNSKDLSIKEVIINDQFPPYPEKDILWFLINYAPLEDWQKDVLQVIREEAFYFYPQHQTKISNEGFASYIHAELMLLSDDIHEKEHLDFAKVHERVVQPGTNKLKINPYFLGFSILTDIRKRWDKLHKEGKSEITGNQKVLEVIEDENDVSFIKNYLTQELVGELDLFVYKRFYDANKDEYLEIESRKVDDVAESIVADLNTYAGAPDISITGASHDALELEHDSTDVGTLDIKHLEQVMGYLFEIWGSPVDLKTVDESNNELHYTFDEEGLSDPEEEVTDKIIIK